MSQKDEGISESTKPQSQIICKVFSVTFQNTLISTDSVVPCLVNIYCTWPLGISGRPLSLLMTLGYWNLHFLLFEC